MLKVTQHEGVVWKNCLNPDWNTRYPGWILIWFSFVSLKNSRTLHVLNKQVFSVTFWFIIYQSTLVSCQCPHHEGVWGMEVDPLSILTSALEDVDDNLSAPVALHPTKNPNTHWIGGWVEPRANVDGSRKETIYCPYRDSNTGTSSTLRVAMSPTVDATEYRTWIFQLRHSIYQHHNSCTL